MKSNLLKVILLVGLLAGGKSVSMSAQSSDSIAVAIDETDWEGGVEVTIPVETSIDAVSEATSDIAVPVTYFDLAGRKMDEPLVGEVNIILFSDGTRKKVRVNAIPY